MFVCTTVVVLFFRGYYCVKLLEKTCYFGSFACECFTRTNEEETDAGVEDTNATGMAISRGL